MQLRDWVEEAARGLEERMATAERAHRRLRSPTRSLVRYDAYERDVRPAVEHRSRCSTRTGPASWSRRSSTATRRALYVKQVREGELRVELSPEEQEAVDAAMAGAPAGA